METAEYPIPTKKSLKKRLTTTIMLQRIFLNKTLTNPIILPSLSI